MEMQKKKVGLDVRFEVKGELGYAWLPVCHKRKLNLLLDWLLRVAYEEPSIPSIFLSLSLVQLLCLLHLHIYECLYGFHI